MPSDWPVGPDVGGGSSDARTPSVNGANAVNQSSSIAWGTPLDQQGPGAALSGNNFLTTPQTLDQSAVYSALMSFMVEAARSQ